jgi:DNA ligase-1
VRFTELVEVYGKLEATTKRLEMRALLVGLIERLSIDELPEVLYLSQGLLRPEYEGIELGMADSLAAKSVALATGLPDPEVLAEARSSGDLGTTVERLLENRSSAGAGLTVAGVYQVLTKIARASGEGSQETKVQVLAELLHRCSPTEAKYAVRFVLGKLRLGVREMTILDALAVAFGGGTKEARAQIEAAFNVSSDLGLVAQALARSALEGLGEIHLTVGRPVRPMLAERSPDLADVLKRMEGRAALEYKYDGLRVQAHVPQDGPVKLFSRRLEDISAQFPELLVDLPKAIARRPAIVEGECVSIDPETDEIRPFQEISRRRGRKYDLERMQQEIPVCLFLFDLLLEGDRSQIDEPLPERRAHLAKLVRPTDRIRLAVQKVVENVDDAQAFFDQSIADGCEGVMAKSLDPGGTYHPGGRGFWWIKYKREYTQGLADSVDGVVVGAFHGKGRRGGKYGALLMAVYNPDQDRYESFCKVGSGFDDAALDALPKRLKPFEVDDRPEGVLTELTPDRWITPTLVLEVRGAELSLSPIHRAAVDLIRPGAGLALRFPRFTGRYREDKGPTDATTSQELVALYRSQVRQSSATTSAPE